MSTRRPRQMVAIHDYDEPYEFDAQRRMKYHKDYHPNQGRRWLYEELAYLATFYPIDGRRSTALALGRTESTCSDKYFELKKKKQLEKYRRFYG